MAIEIVTLTAPQFAELLSRGEGHFLDFKAKAVTPAKLTKALSAFANADGGELFIGVLDIRIFDNRIEVQSPGVLPAHVTVDNILEERFARNQRLVRLINKYEDPPNKDVGEGLNTAFEAMRKLKFRDPTIEQLDGSVRITLRHEKLASPEEIICEFLRKNPEINNSKARDITFIGSENTVKRIFNKMLKSKIIERIPDRPQAKTGYQKGANFPKAVK